ncbi:arabinogalactan endo-beta-1,4-galactanase [Gracilimonas sp. Q87]|uniref:glycoside hydrolase family 53 protein n=1 Tax=Gracilimonas sp. Q87 TaxID=3384766 RepID=UPI003983FD4F
MKRTLTFFLLLPLALLTANSAKAQDFYFGNDLSYVNQMEDCGADFKEWMQPKDVYDLYAERGNDLVRVRLWVDPAWQEELNQPAGVKPVYSNFEDVKETIQRSKAAGMQVLLDLHYSDFWADPGRQVIPSRWYDIAFDEEALADSVYNYTHKVLSDLNTEGLMPEMVQVGNETNSGMMTHRSMDENFEATEPISSSWQRHAKMFNTGIQAVRDVSATSTVDTKVVLHYAGVGSGLDWWYQNAISNGITDFDVIGFSYYYAWHGSSVEAVGEQIGSLSQSYPDKEIMILETGYPWTDENFDSNGNIITDTTPEYSPPSPSVQLDYLVNLTKEVMASGGHGVIFWESAWVTTSCTTPWATGSSHDHVVFFEPFTDNFIGSGGGLWLDPGFYVDMNSIQVIYKVDMNGQDQSNGVYIAIDENEDGLKISKRMYHEGYGIYSYTTYLSPGTETASFFHTGSDPQNRETVPAACATSGVRVTTVSNANMETGYQWGTCDAIAGAGSRDLLLTISAS